MKKINNRLVEGDGFKVEILKRYVIMYYEGDKVIRLSILGEFEPTISIYFDKVKWGLDYSVDWLNEEEKERVKTRVGKALNLLGVKHKFDTNESPF